MAISMESFMILVIFKAWCIFCGHDQDIVICIGSEMLLKMERWVLKIGEKVQNKRNRSIVVPWAMLVGLSFLIVF